MDDRTASELALFGRPHRARRAMRPFRAAVRASSRHRVGDLKSHPVSCAAVSRWLWVFSCALALRCAVACGPWAVWAWPAPLQCAALVGPSCRVMDAPASVYICRFLRPDHLHRLCSTGTRSDELLLYCETHGSAAVRVPCVGRATATDGGASQVPLFGILPASSRVTAIRAGSACAGRRTPQRATLMVRWATRPRHRRTTPHHLV